MKIRDIITEDNQQLDEINWKKAGATAAMGLAGLGAGERAAQAQDFATSAPISKNYNLSADEMNRLRTSSDVRGAFKSANSAVGDMDSTVVGAKKLWDAAMGALDDAYKVETARRLAAKQAANDAMDAADRAREAARRAKEQATQQAIQDAADAKRIATQANAASQKAQQQADDARRATRNAQADADAAKEEMAKFKTDVDNLRADSNHALAQRVAPKVTAPDRADDEKWARLDNIQKPKSAKPSDYRPKNVAPVARAAQPKSGMGTLPRFANDVNNGKPSASSSQRGMGTLPAFANDIRNGRASG